MRAARLRAARLRVARLRVARTPLPPTGDGKCIGELLVDACEDPDVVVYG